MECPGKCQRLSLSVPATVTPASCLVLAAPAGGAGGGEGVSVSRLRSQRDKWSRGTDAPSPWAIPPAGEAVGTRQGLGVSGLRSTSWSEVATVSPTGRPAQGLHLATGLPESEHRGHAGGPTEERVHCPPGPQLHCQQQVRPPVGTLRGPGHLEPLQGALCVLFVGGPACSGMSERVNE